MGRALAPIEQLLAQWPVIVRARAGWAALRAFLEAMPRREAPTELPRPGGRLGMRGVTVIARMGEPPILSNVTLDLAPGEALGVIGKSGAGKSTLARVMLELVRPQAGEVRLDGATLDQYGPERLGEAIGYLPQEVTLFDGSIAENIARMVVAPDPERVVAAARRAHVHDVILKLPKGYDTPVGAGGAQLSGGQKQRLALARALYGNPVILVLDEPNSALDADGSEALNAAVRELKAAGGSVIIMTHRPTAIASCDTLLVLEAGRIGAFGPRDKVLKSMVRNAGDIARVVSGGGRR
jgi:ATP-binding cassette subfamily C protein